MLRTVQSVIDRSPPQFLEEVLLVDDYSDKGFQTNQKGLEYIINRYCLFAVHLKKKLEDFIERYNGKVRLIRNKEREGLIRTRTRGAEEARGEVVLYFATPVRQKQPSGKGRYRFHAQIFTGNKYSNGGGKYRGKWSASWAGNYGTNFVYRDHSPWTIYWFRFKDEYRK